MATDPLLIECRARNPVEEIEALVPGPIVACDFYIEGIENYEEVPWGYRSGRVLNLDHHAPTDRMMRHVSSTNLAIDLVRSGWINDGTVVINHTDCDSVLSAGIVSGILEPLDSYGEAAIAADHTGVRNEIADLLQGREANRDFAGSIADLRALEKGKPFSEAGRLAMERYYTDDRGSTRSDPTMPVHRQLTIVEPDERSKDCSLRWLLFDSLAG